MQYKIGSGRLYLSNAYNNLSSARSAARRASKNYAGDINIYQCDGCYTGDMIMAYTNGRTTYKA